MSYDAIRTKLLTLVRNKIHAEADHVEWSREDILRFQQKQLKKLLAHATQHSPYYQKRCHLINQFEDIKPSTKKEIMDNWDEIICVADITRDIAEHHLLQYRNQQIPNPFFKEYYVTATGGSSGTRGLFVWDLDYFATIGYATFRYQYRDEQKKPPLGPKKIAVLTAPTLIHASTPLFSITLSDEEEFRHFPADLNINEMCHQLNQFQPSHLIGYSSIITELAYRAQSGSLSISPQRVSTNSEPLSLESRKMVRKVWGLEIHNMWGSVEMGMAGIESDQHCGLFVTDDLLIIEPVDDELHPVENPADTKKLLITNLFNFSFPLIRYVVDDAVVITSVKNSGYRVAKDIEGRADDWFIYHKNIKIHPMVFRAVLGQEPAIVEYQVEQTSQGAIIRLVADAEVDTEQLNHTLTLALQDAGLTSPMTQIEVLMALPRHHETGKLKRFIPLKN